LFTLSNKQISVSVLDPMTDCSHLGSRYCTGGYIWQIEDTKWGPLMSGPCFPELDPLPFHGQGAPETFVTPLGTDGCDIGDNVTIIGVGTVVRTSDTMPFHVRDNPTVKDFCRWNVEHALNKICMSTIQQSREACISLSRTVELKERTVLSLTEVDNQSALPLPLRWFVHPFFPLNYDLRCCRINFTWSVPENPGYRKNTECMLCMKGDYAWEKGLFMKLEIPAGALFSATVIHPYVSSIEITADYPLESLPVWANDKTFSPEPYMSRTVAPGERTAWKIEYRIDE
jgi:hypothetical protein